jgi:hypothetical protein
MDCARLSSLCWLVRWRLRAMLLLGKSLNLRGRPTARVRITWPSECGRPLGILVMCGPTN